jgi:hypothetical protein
MPTMTGSIWGQNVGYRNISSDGTRVDEVSLNLHFRDVTADSALSLISHTSKSVWAECGFSSINSLQEGIEDFDPGVPRVVRKGVGFLTFRTVVVDCHVNARWSINYWQQQTAAAAPAVVEPEYVATFLGYDKSSGDVVYTHEILREPGAPSEGEVAFDPEMLGRRIVRQFPGRRVEIMKAPESLRLQGDVRYRVDPATTTIATPDNFSTFADFARAVVRG